MPKCGFCHVAGHNRRSCKEIKKLELRGITVAYDEKIEDFAGELSPSKVLPPSPDVGPPPPSNNPLNVPANPSRRATSPIISASLDDLAADNGLFSSFESLPSAGEFSSADRSRLPSGDGRFIGYSMIISSFPTHEYFFL